MFAAQARAAPAVAKKKEFYRRRKRKMFSAQAQAASAAVGKKRFTGTEREIHFPIKHAQQLLLRGKSKNGFASA